jgi:uncharacterized integral membrane protein (TIGR00698 family)
MKKAFRVIPGFLLCLVLMLVAIHISDWLGLWVNKLQGLPSDSSSPISSIFVAIILGLLIRNILGLHDTFKDGISFSVKRILKIGIVLLGIRLSFYDVITLGAWGIPIILICVLAGLSVTLWITNRLKQSHRLGTLTAVGTGICGVTAIVGTGPGIKANDEEMAYAIGNITIFGILAMFIYPYLAFYLFENDPIRVGLFLGTAIHETAQVAGAALIYDQVYDMAKVVDVATITKLTRNSLLIAVVPIMSYYYLNKKNENRGKNEQTPRWYQLIPLFVIGFILMAGVRTIGDSGINENGVAYGLLNPEQWKTFWKSLNILGSKYMLGIAMVGVGLSTNLKVFKGVGAKPFYIGMVAASTVSVVSIIMVFLLGGLITV